MQDTLESKVHQYLLAREAAESAAKIAKELEDDIKIEMIKKNLHRFKHQEDIIMLIQAERRSFDAVLLKELVSASIFRIVTEAEVRSKMFDAATSVGMIDQQVVEQVVTRTPYTQIRIGKNVYAKK